MNKYLIIKDIEAYSLALRIVKRCYDISKISEIQNGIMRRYLSKEHLLVNKKVGQWMIEAGMFIWQDSVGNICGRYEAVKSGSAALLLGSHLDTVIDAGMYDGILGVITAIEIVEWFYKHQIRFPLAIEIIGFCDEEGTRFGITLLGSLALSNSWDKNWENITDNNGITISQAMYDFGLDFSKISNAVRNINDIVGYLELHIEQGPCLYNLGLSLGVVSNINAANRIKCFFYGESGHAGTVPMINRKDPLIAAAEWIIFIEKETLKQNPKLVSTVGNIKCIPGIANVIPNTVELTLDARGPKNKILDDLISKILSQAKIIALKRKVNFKYDKYYNISAISCDKKIKNILNISVKMVQGSCILLNSGAGHDASAMSNNWPIGMLFVCCKKGISHSPKEFVKINDVKKAVQAYSQTIFCYLNQKF